FFGKIYIGTERNRLLTLTGNSLEASNLRIPDSSTISFITHLDTRYIIGTTAGKIYRCGEDLRMQEIMLEDESYAQASVIMDAQWVNPDLVVLSTLRGGVLIV